MKPSSKTSLTIMTNPSIMVLRHPRLSCPCRHFAEELQLRLFTQMAVMVAGILVELFCSVDVAESGLQENQSQVKTWQSNA